MRLFSGLLAVMALAAPLPVLAATAASSTDPHALCDGQIEMIRISKIKPTGSVAGFLEAVADNNAWYRSHGSTSNIQLAARELHYDKEAKTFSLAEDEIVTIHINPPGPDGRTVDAAWNAFVKKYEDNSEIVTQKMICVRKMK